MEKKEKKFLNRKNPPYSHRWAKNEKNSAINVRVVAQLPRLK